eukprot:TRINITY_DN65594_c0_g1_i3.p3 TRINITY_DN65594_c0_g1~~TRINITY_DN65594_c0_g1_i3.p3  ORF type:complete len:111 (-),score=22.86 TRINITY_DN65594_c0_g1_i3:182-514(-)
MSLLQNVSSSVSRLVRPSVCSFVVKGMSTLQGLPKYDEKERGEENLYFSKEDEKTLRKLLAKVKQQADTDAEEKYKHEAAEREALKGIVSKYNIAQDDFLALLKWKHEQY